MPKSLSHVVVLTDDLDAVVRFLTEVANVSGVAPYETEPEDVARPGGVDVVEIPEALRDTVRPGARLLAVVNRDAAGSGEAAASAGFTVRGPFRTTAATGAPMAIVEVMAGGVAFELVQFG